MSPPTSPSGFGVKLGLAAFTTGAALAAMLALTGQEGLPSKYYELLPPFSSGYEWEIREDYDRSPTKETLASEQFRILHQFVVKIAAESKDLEPQYDQLISKHFWELV